MQDCNAADSSDDVARLLAKSQSSDVFFKSVAEPAQQQQRRARQWDLAERNAKRELKQRRDARIAEAQESAFDFASALRQILGDDEQPLVGFRWRVAGGTSRRRTPARSGCHERSGKRESLRGLQDATAAMIPMRRRIDVGSEAGDRSRRCGVAAGMMGLLPEAGLSRAVTGLD